MRYLKIVMLLLAVTVGTQACIIPVPIGGGWRAPSPSPRLVSGRYKRSNHRWRRRGARLARGGGTIPHGRPLGVVHPSEAATTRDSRPRSWNTVLSAPTRRRSRPIASPVLGFTSNRGKFGLGLGLVVGRAVEEDRAAVSQGAGVASGAVDVGRHADAVAHGDHCLLGQVHVEVRTGGAGGGIEGLHWAARSLPQASAGASRSMATPTSRGTRLF